MKRDIPAAEQISTQKLRRLSYIVKCLKENRIVNRNTMRKEIAALNPETSQMDYTGRTIERDFETLREVFQCPMKYDSSLKSQVLLDKSWSMGLPATLEDSDMAAVVLGGRLAEEICPEPMKSQIMTAVTELINHNSTASIDMGNLASLKIFPANPPCDISDVFPAVFEGWRSRHVITIDYEDTKGRISERRPVDPHVLLFFEGNWYMRAWCHREGRLMTFMLARIRKATVLKSSFIPDRAIVDAADQNTVFSFRRIAGVRIRLNRDGYAYAKVHRLHAEQTLEEETDNIDSFILTVPDAAEIHVIEWILARGGDAVPLEPQTLVDAVREKVSRMHQALC